MGVLTDCSCSATSLEPTEMHADFQVPEIIDLTEGEVVTVRIGEGKNAATYIEDLIDTISLVCSELHDTCGGKTIKFTDD